jgi:hypothetical protein
MADSRLDREVRVIDWEQLRRRFPEPAVDGLRQKLSGVALYSVTADAFAADAQLALADARSLLDAVVATGEMRREEQRNCSVCGFDLADTDAKQACPECQASFADSPPVTVEQYVRPGELPRLVPWFLVVHGMNTRGEWQETLTWLIGRSYRQMVPVAIYKYGKIQPGVLFPFRQRQLMRKLTVKMKTLAAESAAAELEGQPDVIAHSFGTWLVANALLNDASLKIGRLILLGSIVPPDFPWAAIVERGQVEAILNHGATNDGWVPGAHYAIPKSGPGGTRGFPPPVVNIPAKGLGHSDYFRPDWRLNLLFRNVWQPFLSWNVPRFTSQPVSPESWSPSWPFTRAITWSMVVIALASVALGALTVFLLGLRQCWMISAAL